MKNISLKKLVCYLAIASLPISMIACGGSSSNGGGNNSGVSLTLTAPSMYPAGSSSAINAMLTINNTSNESALGLQYSVPSDLNTTGVDISVLNDDS
ncbi:MAG: hypothetical protein PHC75_07250, partial [Burkholderiales bacterium]|nr:hypothetical protein [Burkholderiales bacterium]